MQLTHYENAKNDWRVLARREFKPGDRQHCHVCGKYKSITQAHHVYQLSNQDQRFTADHTHVWLCPNHHVLVHALLRANDFTSVVTDMDEKELIKVLEVLSAEIEGN